MADHADYSTGEPPAAHAASHEDGGEDEISIEGLEGESVELATHAGLPAVHHARYTDAEALSANFAIMATLGTL